MSDPDTAVPEFPPEPAQTELPPEPPAAPQPPREKAFDLFELVAALILGLGAVGAAWASLQGNSWGGNASVAYQEANNETTKASTLFNLGVATIAHDAAVDVQAKRLILETATLTDPTAKQMNMYVAKYLYAVQLSEPAYTSLQCPAGYRGAMSFSGIPEDQLLKCANNELLSNDAYMLAVIGTPTKQFQDANTKFEGGRKSDSVAGDFAHCSVYFTVAMFIAGLGLVLKTKIRWGFLGLGSIAIAGATIYLLTLKTA